MNVVNAEVRRRCRWPFLSGGLKALGDLEICLGACITLGRIFEQVWGFLAVLLPFLFVLTVVVFVHELGHFLVARWCGVRVKAFSIGFGREIFGFWDRHGTRWRVASGAARRLRQVHG